MDDNGNSLIQVVFFQLSQDAFPMAYFMDSRYQDRKEAFWYFLLCVVVLMLTGLSFPGYAQETPNPKDTPEQQADRKKQKFTYTVKIEAPLKIKNMLQDNLSIAKWQHSAEMNDRQLRRMYRAAPVEVRELMETEGYYSPEVDAQLLGERGDRTVVILVKPGKPVKVTDVRITLEGDVAGTKASRSFPGEEGLKKGWKMPVGTVFRMEDWETAKLYCSRNFPVAVIPGQPSSIPRRLLTLKPILHSWKW